MRDGEADPLREAQAVVLVLRESFEPHARWLEDVGGGHAAEGHTPTRAVAVERDLGLRTGEAELALVARSACLARVDSDGGEASFDLLGGEPLHAAWLVVQGAVALRRDELKPTRAVFSDVREQAERVARRDVELTTPTFEYELVVGEQAPEEGVDRVGGVGG